MILKSDTFATAWRIVLLLSMSALFIAAWFMAETKFFTTWSLGIFAVFYILSSALSAATFFHVKPLDTFVTDGTFARWVFAPCLIISLAVAFSVLFLMYNAWGVTWEEECEGRRYACRDIVTSFVVTHYLPPVALFLTSVVDEKMLVISTRINRATQTIATWRYVTLLFQVSILPVELYSTFFDFTTVYSTDGTYGTAICLFIYMTTSVCISIVWGGLRGGHV